MKMKKSMWNLLYKIVRRAVDKKFEYSFEDFDLGAIEGPVLIVTNHVCAWDPLFIALASNRQLAFVASEHILRIPRLGRLAEKYLDAIPHTKASSGTKATKECIKRLKAGEAIFIASEGEQSWDGKSKDVVATTGKLVKKSGATLVTYRIEGGYIAFPRWAEKTRRGKVYVHPVNVYTPAELEKMSAEEIKAAINRDIAFDVWEWQREELSRNGKMNEYISEKNCRAEYLERLVYICPSCRKIGTLRSHGNEVECSCGFKNEITETGFLKNDMPFATISEWSDWQDGELEKLLGDESEAELQAESKGQEKAQGDSSQEKGFLGTECGDKDFVLLKINGDHTEEIVSEGELALGRIDGGFKLSIGDTSFDLSDISRMAMILANRIVFSSDEMYYEIRPHDMKGRHNLRKYLVAWQRANANANEEEE